MAVNLDALTAEVANNTTVSGSVVALVNQIATQLANMPASSDPATQAAIDALVAQLTQSDSAIADAVVKNTPST